MVYKNVGKVLLELNHFSCFLRHLLLLVRLYHRNHFHKMAYVSSLEYLIAEFSYQAGASVVFCVLLDNILS